MFMHVRLQLTFSHAWTCTYVQVEVERKTLDCVCCNPGVILIHDSFTGWLRPYLSQFIDPNQMVASILRILIIMYSLWMAATMPHISCIWTIILYLSMQILGGSYMCSCKAFHPSLSLGPHALRGICYTVICHHWSPSLLPLFSYIGGYIPGPVSSNIA